VSLRQQIKRAVAKFRKAEFYDERQEGHYITRKNWNLAWPTGCCTNSALWLKEELSPVRSKVVGYAYEDNPKARAGRDEGGHDFLVVDETFIVDVWLKDTYGGPLVTRLNDDRAVAKWYGDPEKWVEIDVSGIKL